MISKVIALVICVSFCFPVFGNSFNAGYVITEDRKDSTVNLRESESLHSKVLAKISNGMPMSCSFDASDNPNFCFVRFDQSNDVNTGYIYKNKLAFLANDSSFNKILLDKSCLYSATYKNNEIVVKIKLTASKLNNKDFSWQTKNDVSILMYQNKRVYGTDNEIMHSVYLYSAIDIDINGNKYSIPTVQFKGLFIPSYFIENKSVFNNISIYYNVTNKLMYIFSTQADGAAVYTVVFELKNNVLIKTHVWSESY